MSNPQTILIYGGSFDPPHRGHIELPSQVANVISANRIIYIPTGTPPHKTRKVTDAKHRLAMLQLALSGINNVEINTCEIERPGRSYTVDTLQSLHQKLNHNHTLRLLIGADMAASFYTWKNPQQVIQLAEPVVMLREPYTADQILSTLPKSLSAEERNAWQNRIVNVNTIDTSSTELRKLLNTNTNKKALTQMLAPEVLNYIQEHDLYHHTLKD